MSVRLLHTACGLYFAREYEGVIDAAKRLIRSYPDFPMIYRWPAAALGQLGRTAEAKEWLEKAISAAPSAFNMYVRNRRRAIRPPDPSVDGIEGLIGKRQVSTANSVDIEPVSLHVAARRNLTRAPSLASAYIHREADHVQKDRPAHLREPRHARRRLALARGYWLHLSDHHGDDRLSEQAPRSRCEPVS